MVKNNNLAFYVNDKRLLNNNLFSVDYDRDNVLKIFRECKLFLNKKGYNVNTFDKCRVDECKFIFYFDVPYDDIYKKNVNQNILIILENQLIWPQNWNLENHQYFKYIFTWSDELIDNIKYFKFLIPQELSISKNFDNLVRKRYTLIASNKINRNPGELYNIRRNIINYFENGNLDFEFYGFGWNKKIPLNSLLFKLIDKLHLNFLNFPTNFKNYKGEIMSKDVVLSKYLFSFCFENAEINGYITEKIFDCFRNGTIPIYLGDKLINNYIPSDCLINVSSNIDINELIDVLENISDNDILKYKERIKYHLLNNNFKIFSYDNFNNTVFSKIIS